MPPAWGGLAADEHLAHAEPAQVEFDGVELGARLDVQARGAREVVADDGDLPF